MDTNIQYKGFIKQRLKNLSRKGFVPRRGLPHSVT